MQVTWVEVEDWFGKKLKHLFLVLSFAWYWLSQGPHEVYGIVLRLVKKCICFFFTPRRKSFRVSEHVPRAEVTPYMKRGNHFIFGELQSRCAVQ